MQNKKFLASQWLNSGESDLITIDETIENPLLTHVVAFHAQQCIEKAFKALVEISSSDVPKIHSTVTLYEMVKSQVNINIDEEILDKLDQLYIDARYPGELGLMPYGKPTSEEAKKFYEFAKEIYNSIKRIIEEE